MATRLPKGYSPNEGEPFMNARQREYFRRKLQEWKDDIVKGTRETVNAVSYTHLTLPTILLV